jgi:hypothetical protein
MMASHGLASHGSSTGIDIPRCMSRGPNRLDSGLKGNLTRRESATRGRVTKLETRETEQCDRCQQ